jgi:hypothetical protein
MRKRWLIPYGQQPHMNVDDAHVMNELARACLDLMRDFNAQER